MKKFTRIIIISMSLLTIGLSNSLTVSAETSANGLTVNDAGKASCQGTYGGGELSEDELDQKCRQYLRSLGSDYAGLKDPKSPHTEQYVMVALAATFGLAIGICVSIVILRRRASVKTKRMRNS